VSDATIIFYTKSEKIEEARLRKMERKQKESHLGLNVWRGQMNRVFSNPFVHL
jgi:hypothetical protein